jgi:hypothetical protein
MRTSGGRGADAWLLAIPVVALLIAGSMSEGGFDSVLLTLNNAIRDTAMAGLELARKLF